MMLSMLPNLRFRFIVSDDVQMISIRNKFFEGEIGYIGPSSHTRTQNTVQRIDATPRKMLEGVPERLRDVVVRACSTSQATVKVLDAYEEFLVQSFGERETSPASMDNIISGHLLEPPTVTQTKSGSTVARFCFDSESSAGGFHRLLLHAVCNFHSLHAASTTVDSESRDSVRLLTVTGTILGPHVRLSQVIQSNNNHAICTNVAQLTSSLSTLRV